MEQVWKIKTDLTAFELELRRFARAYPRESDMPGLRELEVTAAYRATTPGGLEIVINDADGNDKAKMIRSTREFLALFAEIEPGEYSSFADDELAQAESAQADYQPIDIEGQKLPPGEGKLFGVRVKASAETIFAQLPCVVWVSRVGPGDTLRLILVYDSGQSEFSLQFANAFIKHCQRWTGWEMTSIIGATETSWGKHVMRPVIIGGDEETAQLVAGVQIFDTVPGVRLNPEGFDNFLREKPDGLVVRRITLDMPGATGNPDAWDISEPQIELLMGRVSAVKTADTLALKFWRVDFGSPTQAQVEHIREKYGQDVIVGDGDTLADVLACMMRDSIVNGLRRIGALPTASGTGRSEGQNDGEKGETKKEWERQKDDLLGKFAQDANKQTIVSLYFDEATSPEIAGAVHLDSGRVDNILTEWRKLYGLPDRKTLKKMKREKSR